MRESRTFADCQPCIMDAEHHGSMTSFACCNIMNFNRCNYLHKDIDSKGTIRRPTCETPFRLRIMPKQKPKVAPDQSAGQSRPSPKPTLSASVRRKALSLCANNRCSCPATRLTRTSNPSLQCAGMSPHHDCLCDTIYVDFICKFEWGLFDLHIHRRLDENNQS